MTTIKTGIQCTKCGKDILYCNCENSPKTKIAELKEENAELKEENAELKAQIEKMRNCQNCKNSCGNNCKLGSKDYFCNYDKWECR